MSEPFYIPEDKIPLPPPDAEKLTTACDYCVVACGYVAYRWPVGKEGGPRAHENALGLDYPLAPMKGGWISPTQHNIVTFNRRPHHVVVIPDKDTRVVNVGGDHSIRGGTIARKLFNPETPTRDRLQHPMLRVDGKLQPISWDAALDIMAAVSKHVIKKHGRNAWAMKMFSYQFFENTHALTRVALRHVRTAAFAVHDQPTGHGSDTPGISDAGLDPFAASYEDWSLAEVLLLAGTDPFESKTIIFNEWIMKGVREGMKLIFINPRKTTGIAYGEKFGGIHLDLYPGSDTVLYMALARIILENGWEDTTFIDQFINNKLEQDLEVFQADGIDDYRTWLLAQDYARLDKAAEITGVAPEKIQRAAEMLAKPRPDGSRPRTSFGFEKGCYWSNNYLNTASLASLGLICGAGNRPGQMISRLGGHQRGMMPGGSYPELEAFEKFPGRQIKGIDLDRYVEDGHVRFAWVIGTTWLQAMTASQHLMNVFRDFTRGNPHQCLNTDTDHAISVLKQRVESGGMVVVHQDIYPVAPIGTEFADLVLPAAGWGEETFSRANGERRIRIYSKLSDPPGEAKPDWWIAARFAGKMGFRGMDWKTSNDVFEAAAWFGKTRRTSYFALVQMARKHGKNGHELLREYGTEGIQAPVRYEDGKLIGTKRLHDRDLRLGTSYNLTGNEHRWLTDFNTPTGRANLLKTPWEIFSDFYEHINPKDDELWVTSGRINEFWQSGFDDQMRRPYLKQRWPANFVEIHPDDAKARGIESGDQVLIYSKRVPVQVGGYSAGDAEVRGVVLDDKLVKEEEPDLLIHSVEPDRFKKEKKEGWDATSMTADVEGDLLLSPGFDSDDAYHHDRKNRKKGPKTDPNKPRDEVDRDPLLEEVETGIGLSWSQIKPLLFAELLARGYIKFVEARFEAVAIVTEGVRPKVAFTYFLVPGSPANSLAPRVLDPISQRPRYKLGTAKIKKIGESPYKHTFHSMSFAPRTII